MVMPPRFQRPLVMSSSSSPSPSPSPSPMALPTSVVVALVKRTGAGEELHARRIVVAGEVLASVVTNHLRDAVSRREHEVRRDERHVQKPLPRLMNTVASSAAVDGEPPMVRGSVPCGTPARTPSGALDGAARHATRPTRPPASGRDLRMRRTLDVDRAIVETNNFAGREPQFCVVAIGQRHHYAPVRSLAKRGYTLTACVMHTHRAATLMRRRRG